VPTRGTRPRDMAAYHMYLAKNLITSGGFVLKVMAVKLTLVEERRLGLAGRVPGRVDAATKAGLLDLLAEALDIDWTLRRACYELERRAHRWIARRPAGSSPTWHRAGSRRMGCSPTMWPRSWPCSTSGARTTTLRADLDITHAWGGVRFALADKIDMPTGGPARMADIAKESDVWTWPDSLDAVVAAPGSHRVIFENRVTRVLEVTIAPGEREPEHTHRWPSVMVVHRPARIRYYTGDTLTFTSPEQPPPADRGLRLDWLNPEVPHSVENIDSQPYEAFRIEFKQH
jgi:hypothetical protein